MKSPEDIAAEIILLKDWDNTEGLDGHPILYEVLKSHIAAAIEADRAEHRTRVMQLCRAWARYWNALYEESSRRRKGRVMWHLIGTAVGAVGHKILDDEEPPKE